jgi:hypothetical protein
MLHSIIIFFVNNIDKIHNTINNDFAFYNVHEAASNLFITKLNQTYTVERDILQMKQNPFLFY